MTNTQLLIPEERIQQAILLIRGHKIMLDADLKVVTNCDHLSQFTIVFDAIRGLMEPSPEPDKGKIGFKPKRLSH